MIKNEVMCGHVFVENSWEKKLFSKSFVKLEKWKKKIKKIFQMEYEVYSAKKIYFLIFVVC